MSEDLAKLLERAGFHVRGKRADCIHCAAEGHGHGRGTVAFTDEVAFCHRCKWTGNARTLSRQLGISLPPQKAEDISKRRLEAEFEGWLGTFYMVLIRRLWRIRRVAHLAEQLLAEEPENKPAWEALERFCEAERAILAALEFISFDKTPQYQEKPMIRERLFAAFAEARDRLERNAA